MSITRTFHVCQTFWFISLPTVHDNDNKFSDRSGQGVHTSRPIICNSVLLSLKLLTMQNVWVIYEIMMIATVQQTEFEQSRASFVL